MPDPGAGTVRRIYGNLGKLLGGKAAAGILSLIYMAVAARALGPRDYGVLVLVHGFAMTVGGIVEFPGWHAIVRYGAEARATGDAPRLARLLRFAAVVEGAGGACAVLVAAVLGPLLGARLGWSPVALAFAVPYSFAVLASIRATPAGFLQLTGRFDLLGLHNIVSPVIRLAGAVVAALVGGGLHAFLIAWLVAALAEWAAMWGFGLYVARQTLEAGWSRGGLAGVRRENRAIWRFMLAANADVTLGELAGRLAPLVIGAVLGAAPAGLFAIAQRATTVIAQPAQVLGQAAYAELARLVAAGGHGRALRMAVARCLGAALVVAVPLVVGLIVFGRELVVAMAGAAFAGAAGVLVWLALARAMLLVAPPVSAALTALGRPGLSVVSNLGANLGLLPLLPLLLAQGGLAGAGWFALAQAIVTAALLIACLLHATRATVSARRTKAA
ncbi:lipopolysaccharide biosynthesis protein [Sphingomonas solaris]|uniref:Oligosaccharide flippase family protein n=1 Tax=Alterirhizorhabdus solaris TaxID=2529389 RepID=A0A558R535_9SPHN|nr:oligosaccharide flippase family protein [Sphingomonas solaris]TVV74458.1 oligosaccharide flippase family protein [Sphingomonas solaris]